MPSVYDLIYWPEWLTARDGSDSAQVTWSFSVTFIVIMMTLAAFGVIASDSQDVSPNVPLSTERKSVRKLRLPDQCVRAGQSSEPRRKSLALRLYMRVMSTNDLAKTLEWDNAEFDISNVGDRRPLVVFINRKSGGGQGVSIISELRLLLHKLQIVDLQDEGPEDALKWWSTTGLKYRVLVCGGDGTIAWVLETIERLELDYAPPVAVMPLGTGNDLARVLGWGGGFSGGNVSSILKEVADAHAAVLDRWQLVFRDVACPGRPVDLPAEGRERKRAIMCNYFGIGVDAAVALDFHQMRESSPHLFVSRLINKLWYIRSGTLNFLKKSCKNLASKVVLECDGKVIEVPANLEGIVVLNIPSFGGGSDLWGSAVVDTSGSEDTDSSDDTSPTHSKSVLRSLSSLRPSMQDQRLEVVGVHGSFQLGAAQIGLYKAKRLAQCSTVRIVTKASLPVQVDGEPWMFDKDGEIDITWRSEAFMLSNSTQAANSGLATDIVEWALQRKVITAEQRNTMQKEIARRALRAQSASAIGLSSMG
eukprot:TRINITY_DN124538_c0_g1_i1.p1 TRINITY_DN124538_c0_g1~~TRINITY_DN124538_c0_g1_i1.p1  ORF type:complete len:533 (+),score=96.96 TRINITY_DN124538_c0_g1_i1:84-1682(+)